jgi:hypothetical protein
MLAARTYEPLPCQYQPSEVAEFWNPREPLSRQLRVPQKADSLPSPRRFWAGKKCSASKVGILVIVRVGYRSDIKVKESSTPLELFCLHVIIGGRK